MCSATAMLETQLPTGKAPQKQRGRRREATGGAEAQTGTSGCELVSLEGGDGDGRAPPTLCKWRSTATAG